MTTFAIATALGILAAWPLTSLTYWLADFRAEREAEVEVPGEWQPETDAAHDEAIALTVPLQDSERFARIAAIIAGNEARRADWSEPGTWAL